MDIESTTNDRAVDESIFKIGRVISVDGRTVKVKVDKTKNTSHLIYKGDLIKNISVGGYIKIIKGFTKIIGKVEGEFINEEKQFDKKSYHNEKEKINRVLSVSLLGFFKGNKFERGIKELPLIDNKCFLLKNYEFNQVHNFIKEGDEALTIGTLALEKGQPISLGINSLFASHIGIFGNTGSGKSYTLAKIYRELFNKYKNSKKFTENAKFFLIDFNGEYVSQESDKDQDDVIIESTYKDIYNLSTRNSEGKDRFLVTENILNSPDFWIVFLEATEKTQAPFLRRSLLDKYIPLNLESEVDLKSLIADKIHSMTTKDDRTLEKGVVNNFLDELNNCLDNNDSINALLYDYREHLKFHSKSERYYYEDNETIYSNETRFRSNIVDAKVQRLEIDIDQITPIDKIRLRIVVRYFDEIVKGFSNREHLAPLIKRMDKRIDDLKKVIQVNQSNNSPVKKSITIVALKDVNIHIRKVLPLLLCKMFYDNKKKENNNQTYLNLIIDEAHNILSETSERESQQWKDYRLETFEEIIKEGRKFGVFLTIASQRPADISPTIISQLHNYFLHRLINNQDIKAVEKTISYLDKVSFEYLPILPTGTCILAGLLANIPVVIDITEIETGYEPNNKTITLVDKWIDTSSSENDEVDSSLSAHDSL